MEVICFIFESWFEILHLRGLLHVAEMKFGPERNFRPEWISFRLSIKLHMLFTRFRRNEIIDRNEIIRFHFGLGDRNEISRRHENCQKIHVTQKKPKWKKIWQSSVRYLIWNIQKVYTWWKTFLIYFLVKKLLSPFFIIKNVDWRCQQKRRFFLNFSTLFSYIFVIF